MKSSLSFDNISLDDFKNALARYHQTIDSKLQGAEQFRNETVPDVLVKRREENNAFLEKTDLVGLVDWKLKSKALSALVKLKGIGPATASLILSCYDRENIPFFSDELFRWLHWQDAKNQKWDRKIKYTMKEYKDLCELLEQLRTRLGKQEVKAIDAEMVAYVLAKEAQGGMSGTLQKWEKVQDDNEKLGPPPPSKKRKLEKSRRGPKGATTYDKLGYKMAYHKIAKAVGPRRRPKNIDAIIDQDIRESSRQGEIMGGPEKSKRSAITYMAWQYRVVKDLKKPYHTITMADFEEWHKRGFKVDDPAQFEGKNITEEFDDILLQLATGSDFREGTTLTEQEIKLHERGP
ncbi:MAG: hypothetical protein M1834_006883 [Cirrosporium novae-zelandiae]|nr:MAG: hypothetical protein M1834_006883 [Cirrosporium novae-zelandiae]